MGGGVEEWRSDRQTSLEGRGVGRWEVGGGCDGRWTKDDRMMDAARGNEDVRAVGRYACTMPRRRRCLGVSEAAEKCYWEVVESGA